MVIEELAEESSASVKDEIKDLGMTERNKNLVYFIANSVEESDYHCQQGRVGGQSFPRGIRKSPLEEIGEKGVFYEVPDLIQKGEFKGRGRRFG